MQLFTRKNLLSLILKGNRFFFKISVLLLLLCSSSRQVKATWYTDNAQQFFKVSFNANLGTIHVESFVHNGSYFGCCGVDRTTELTALNTTLYYTLDNTNYTPFYYYEYSFSVLQGENKAGNTITAYEQVPDGKNRVRYSDFYLPNNLQNIKGIRVVIKLGRGDGAGNGIQNGNETTTDSKTVTVTQMSAINQPTYDFITA